MTATHNIRVTCPLCEEADAVPVQVTTYSGLRATRTSPAEPASFEAEAPDSCPKCGEEFTDEAIGHIGLSAEAWILTTEDAL